MMTEEALSAEKNCGFLLFALSLRFMSLYFAFMDYRSEAQPLGDAFQFT